MGRVNELWLIARVAQMYHSEGLRQADIADRLRLSQATVSRMLKRMETQSLVSHTPYYGVRLTEKGRVVALKVVRRHRLLELFLWKVLNYDEDSVHDEAERLEHHISEEFEMKIDELLGFPKSCPHGSPIPSREGIIL